VSRSSRAAVSFISSIFLSLRSQIVVAIEPVNNDHKKRLA
jgi:hypothetical protein